MAAASVLLWANPLGQHHIAAALQPHTISPTSIPRSSQIAEGEPNSLKTGSKGDKVYDEVAVRGWASNEFVRVVEQQGNVSKQLVEASVQPDPVSEQRVCYKNYLVFVFHSYSKAPFVAKYYLRTQINGKSAFH